MSFELTTHTLILVLQRASGLGALRALCQTGAIRPYLTKAEAYRLYGSRLNHWLALGLINPRKDGDHSATWRIDRIEIETLRIAADLIIFL